MNYRQFGYRIEEDTNGKFIIHEPDGSTVTAVTREAAMIYIDRELGEIARAARQMLDEVTESRRRRALDELAREARQEQDDRRAHADGRP